VLRKLVDHYPKSRDLLKTISWKPFKPDDTAWMKGPAARVELNDARILKSILYGDFIK
jgi:hypothetical protein